jgi:O-antigen/teichoic acid export membrane protein
MNWLARAAKGPGLKAQVVRAGISSFGIKLASTALSFAVATVLARALGTAGYGIYSYVFALVSLLAIPAQLGLPSLVVRETAKAFVNEKWSLMKGLWRSCSIAATLMSVALAAAAGAFAIARGDSFDRIRIATFCWGLVLVPLVALGNLRGAALRGLRKVVVGQLPESVLRPTFLLVFVGLAALATARPLSPDLAMAAHVAAALSSFSIGAWLLLRSRPAELRGVPARTEGQFRSWVTAALPLGLIAAMQLINTQVDILMLGLYVDASQIGRYRIADQVATLVTFFSTAMNVVLAPQISHLYHSNDLARLQSMVTGSARVVLAASVLVFASLAILGRPLIELVFGASYAPAYLPMVILAAGHLLTVSFGPIVIVANMTGHEKTTAMIMLAGTVVNVVLNLVLIPRLGITGAALATVASVAVWRAFLHRSVRRWVGIRTSAIDRAGSA